MEILIEKSPNDPRDHLYFSLQNRMKCLVVSDPSTDMSAASVNVSKGSLQDPPDIPGLAHFLEHMLFMGTGKYPEENHYSNFLAENAGTDNAFTDTENTNYYFRVASDKLRETLDIFSRFFIDPLLKEDAVDREMQAVHSEHCKNIKSDTWRLIQLNRNSANPNHQFNHFATGNIDTLKREDTYTRVRAFYDEHYSSNLMCLCVYGKEDTATLKNWVLECFGEVLDKDKSEDVDMTPPYQGVDLCHITRIVPVLDTKSLRILWVLPSVQAHYKSKPLNYISHLVGHEGVNSLLSMLKKEELAFGLSSGPSSPYKNFSYFQVNIQLTDKGLREWERALELTYAYIKVLRDRGPQEWIFEELKQMAYAEFSFKSKKDPMSYTQQLSWRLSKYPAEDVIVGNDLYHDYEPEAIRSLLDLLVPENMEIYFLAQAFKDMPMETEKWYGTPYKREPLPSEVVAKMRDPQVNRTDIVLDLPLPNKYIPTEFIVHSEGREGGEVTRLLDEEGLVVWHKQDEEYKVDKVCGQLSVYSRDRGVGESAESAVLLKLWKKIWWDKFREENYMADMAGLKLELSTDVLGLKLNLSGFSQKYSVFMLDALKSIFSFNVTDEDRQSFEDYSKKLQKSFENHFFSQPTGQILNIALDCFQANAHFSKIDLLRAVSDINFDDLKYFSQGFLKNARFELLVMGNITAENAAGLGRSLVSTVKEVKPLKFISKNDLIVLKVSKCSSKETENACSNVVLDTCLIDSSNINSTTLANWMIGPETDRKRLACAKVIETFMSEPCFDVLRTKEQLGYIVSSFIRTLRGVQIFNIIIQSSVASPAKLTSRISSFMDGIKQDVLNLEEEKFKSFVRATVKSITKKDVSLVVHFKKHVDEVNNGSYWFSRRQDVAREIENLTLEEFKQIFNKIFYQKCKRLDIEVLSENLKEEHQQFSKEMTRDVLKNSKEFQRKAANYPQVYIRN